MQASEFEEAEFFRAIAASGTRALQIGRRALGMALTSATASRRPVARDQRSMRRVVV